MGTSVVKGAPMVMIARVVGDLCESRQLGQLTQFSITFALAIGYLTIVRFP